MNQLLEKPSFRFTAPFHVEIIESKGLKQVFLEGLISTTHLDLVNDLVTKNCLESMKNQIIEKNLKLDLEHEAFRGKDEEEREINKARIPVGKMIDAEVKAIEKNQFGLFVKSELNPFHDKFEKILGNVQNGFLDAYSIAFIPLKSIDKQVDGKDIRLLDEVTLLNVALTGNPINTHALNHEVFTKSIQSLEDYENEKKANPQIEKQLVVKARSIEERRTAGRNESLRESEDEDEEEKKDHIHESDNNLNKKEVKKMSEETTEKSEIEKAEKPKKEEEDEEMDKKKCSKKAEDSELKSEIESLRKEVSELKAIMNKPILKSKVDHVDKSQNFVEEKSLNPLDVIA